jgi:hypothetical protein
MEKAGQSRAEAEPSRAVATLPKREIYSKKGNGFLDSPISVVTRYKHYISPIWKGALRVTGELTKIVQYLNPLLNPSNAA